jgi:hypothetical protein
MAARPSDVSVGRRWGAPRTGTERSEADQRPGPNTTSGPSSRAITLRAPNDPTGRKQRLLDHFGREPAGFEFSITDALEVARQTEPSIQRRAIEMTLKRMASENDLLVKVGAGRYCLAPQAFGRASDHGQLRSVSEGIDADVATKRETATNDSTASTVDAEGQAIGLAIAPHTRARPPVFAESHSFSAESHGSSCEGEAESCSC